MVPTDQTIVVGWRKNEAWEEKNESHRNSLQALSPSPSLVSASTFVPSFLMDQSGPFLFPLVFQKVGFATYCCINWCLRTNGKVEKVTTSLSLTHHVITFVLCSRLQRWRLQNCIFSRQVIIKVAKSAQKHTHTTKSTCSSKSWLTNTVVV